MTTIDPTAGRLVSEGVAYAPQIAAAAAKNGLDPTLLAALAAQETGGPGSNAGRNIVGDGGHGHGLFQIDDRYHAFANSAAAMDPGQNANYAARMLAGLLRRYGGNVREALSAYNTGDPHATGTTTTWADGTTLGYADSVMHHYDLIAGTTPLDRARGEQSENSISVNALLSRALAAPMVATIPNAPQAISSQSARGLDATGHVRDRGTTSSETSSDEGDDS